MLCISCTAFFNKEWTRKLGTGHYREHGKFHSSPVEQQGQCELCKYLMDCLTTERKLQAEDDMLFEGDVHYDVQLWDGRDVVEHRLSIYISDSSGLRIDVSLNLSRGSSYSEHGASLTPILTTNTRAESCLPQIQKWIEKCTIGHDLCKKRYQKNVAAWHPTRLVNVNDRSLVKLEDDHVKLAEADYLTLSYCWGEISQFWKLRRDNYDDFRRGIAIYDLPKTMQHAIELTRALNITYIWIDACCIIQDSGQDWQQESLKMAQVYGNSYLNIAASSSVNVQGGLFRNRDPTLPNGLAIKPNSVGTEVYIVTRDDDWFSKFLSEPLNLRAWALQERRLSPRTIHFTDSQIYWECSGLCASEVLVDGKPWEYDPGYPDWSSIPRNITVVRDPNHGPSEERYESWWLLVGEYSRGKLTVEEDRLVAIAGLAKSFDTVANDEYFAGHWLCDMPHGLLWCTLKTRTSASAKYLAPSWSWASIPAGSAIGSLAHNKIQARAEILNCNIQYVADQFGPAHGGFMQIRGRMCMARLCVKQVESLRTRTHHDTGGISLKFATACSVAKSIYLEIDYLADFVDKTVFCMELERRWEFVSKDVRSIEHRGLILEPTGHRKGEFRRIGVYCESPFYNPRIKVIIQQVLRVSTSGWRDYLYMGMAFRRRDIPSQNFEALDEKNRYTIRIV